MTKTPDFQIEMTHYNLDILHVTFDNEWCEGVELAYATPDENRTQANLDVHRRMLNNMWARRNWQAAAVFSGFVAGAIRHWKDVA